MTNAVAIHQETSILQSSYVVHLYAAYVCSSILPYLDFYVQCMYNETFISNINVKNTSDTVTVWTCEIIRLTDK